MKFSDGNWLMQPGVSVSAPAQAYEVVAESRGAITIYAPANAVRNRGMTLGGPLLKVRLSSPLEGVIRVTTSHFAGADPAGPQFEINDDFPGAVATVSEEFSAALTSGPLSVQIPTKEPWSINFIAGGRLVTKCGPRASGKMSTPDGDFSFARLSLVVGECVYGLGERFGAFVKNGQVVDMWNKDGGTNSEQAYKNVPFYLTNRGYGVFVNHSEEVSFEVAAEMADSVQFSVPGGTIDYFVIYGPSPKEILERYTALTGRPALPPAWSFGLWLSTSFTTNYDEQTVTSFIQGMEDRGLPLSVFHFDCFWMREFHWCDFQWDSRIFPDPPGMLKRLKDRGLKICVWINPYIAEQSCLFQEGAEAGYFIKTVDGKTWQTDQWQPGMAIVDFTNPAAAAWYRSKLKALLDMGVDAFKTDFGERIPTDVHYFDGSDPKKMHNYYSYLYNKTVFDLLLEERGAGDAIVFARSGTAGSQQLPVHWGGDCDSTFEAMAGSLRGGLSFCLSGFGFWSHDIGGFEGTPPVELYKRWVAFGLLSSHSRLHGSTSYRVPWIYDEEASDVLRTFTKLKCSLMPYLFAKAVEAHELGTPMMRAMFLEFPDDPAVDYLDRQYMLGDSLLVAPIFSADSRVTYYLPRGTWTNYLTNETVTGPGWQTEEHGFDSLPLLVRPNSMLAVGADSDRPDYEYSYGVTFKLYEIVDGSPITVTVPRLDGTPSLTATATRSGKDIFISVSGRAEDWSVLLVGQKNIRIVKGGEWKLEESGAFIKANKYSTNILCTLG